MIKEIKRQTEQHRRTLLWSSDQCTELGGDPLTIREIFKACVNWDANFDDEENIPEPTAEEVWNWAEDEVKERFEQLLYDLPNCSVLQFDNEGTFGDDICSLKEALHRAVSKATYLPITVDIYLNKGGQIEIDLCDKNEFKTARNGRLYLTRLTGLGQIMFLNSNGAEAIKDKYRQCLPNYDDYFTVINRLGLHMKDGVAEQVQGVE